MKTIKNQQIVYQPCLYVVGSQIYCSKTSNSVFDHGTC